VCVQADGRLWLVDVIVKLFTGRYTTEDEMADDLRALGLVRMCKAAASGDCGAAPLPLSAVESRCSAPGAGGATRAPLSLAPAALCDGAATAAGTAAAAILKSVSGPGIVAHHRWDDCPVDSDDDDDDDDRAAKRQRHDDGQ
jgi:hypothetical protein